ncbi:type IV conjugative transfer system protein TraE [Vibrio splendidus]|uniref:type IV conjugative transfer system protein TraE n=1 Tax=Vibrio splendidus TaxID=29497 RepID=UPI003D0E8599
MKKDNYDYIQSLTQSHRRSLMSVIAGCGLLVALLSGALTYVVMNKTRTVLMPPTLTKPVTIGRDYIDRSYLSQLAQYLIWLRYNVTPNNVEAQNAQLLRYLLPSEHRVLKAKLDKEATVVISDEVTSSFFIQGMTVDVESGVVLVTGVQQKYVKRRALAPKSKTITLQFAAPEGLILLASMSQQPEKGANK